MRELLLLRHAKAESKEGQRDFDRELTEGGRKDAARMGRWMGKKGWIPDHVVTSPAPRARQTCDQACEAMGVPRTRIHDDPAIYEAVPVALLAVLASVASNAKRVMLVGHNPGFQALAKHLTQDGRLDSEELDKPSVVRCELPDDWARLPRGAGVNHRIVQMSDIA